MASTPSGTQYAFPATYQAAKTVTGVSNASEAVMSVTAHGYSVGDILQVYSGWGRLNRQLVKVKTITTDTFVAEGINTNNTDIFPAGGGLGTVRKVLTWQSISRYKDQQNSGGEPKNIVFKWTDMDTEESLNDGFTAVTETFNIDADSINDAGYLLLRSLTEVQSDTCLRKTLKNGSKIYTPCTVSLNENPKDSGGVLVCAVAINGNGRLTRYAS